LRAENAAFPARNGRSWSPAARCSSSIFFAREANVAAALTTVIDALGYGPTFTRGWLFPRKDSVTSFALNGAKFVPSLMAMDPISFATSFYPATLLALNAAVSIMLLMRRRAVG